MANEEHVRVLGQGVAVWNQWRAQNSAVIPDLSGIEIDELHLDWIDLSFANLSGARLVEARLCWANLSAVRLRGANLEGANLRAASLDEANLRDAILSGADLTGCKLLGADLRNTELRETNFDGVKIGRTVFGDVDLSLTLRLDSVMHAAPSTVGIDTILRSRGNIPEAFLLGTGATDHLITCARALIDHPIDYYSCVISYSDQDLTFAQRLHADLRQHGVRCWFAPENMQIGDPIRTRIEESILAYDKFVLVLSANSLASAWVADEVEAALDKERRQKSKVLFPITLDNAFEDSYSAWAKKIRRERHIGEFRRWTNPDVYSTGFKRLLRDLKAEEG